MTQSPKIFKKFLGAAGLQIVCRGLSVVSGIIIARYLGPEQYGLYSFVLSITTIGMMVVIAGLPNLLIREVAHAELDRKWGELKGLIRWSSVSILLLASIVMMLIVIALYFGFIESDTASLLWLAVILIPIKSLSSKQGAILNGLRNPILALIPESVLMPATALIFYLVFILFNIEFTGVLLIKVQLLTSILTFLFGLFLIRKVSPKQLINVKPVYQLKQWHTALLPFTAMAFLGTMNVEISSVLLGYLGDKESVGYFKVALQGVTLVTLGLTAVNTISGPNIARLFKSGDLIATQALLTKSVKLSCIFSLPVVVFLVFAGEWVIILLFGNEYAPAAKILVILCVGQVVNACMGSAGLVLNMTGNEKRSLRILLITLVINVLLLATLIPLYADIGAALAVSFSLICWNVLMAIEVYRATSLKTWIFARGL